MIEDKENKSVETSVAEARELFTKENPHPTGAYWDKELQGWRGYKATKGQNPPWLPFSHRERKRKVTINERKFLMVMAQTGSMSQAFRAAYKVTPYPNKNLENARVSASAAGVLKRLREKAPELVGAFRFEDVTEEWIKNEYLTLYKHDHATITEKRSILSDLAKTKAMFTEKTISEVKIKESMEPLYSESDGDFPVRRDDRKDRFEIEKIPVA